MIADFSMSNQSLYDLKIKVPNDSGVEELIYSAHLYGSSASLQMSTITALI